jgi:mRNA-degrading endonuclease toxin of MazEF toxin-antitoxin module
MRDWAFSVRLPAGLKTSGMVLVHQVRAIDRRSRLLDKIDSVPQEFVAEVQGRLAALCGIEDFEKQRNPPTKSTRRAI